MMARVGPEQLRRILPGDRTAIRFVALGGVPGAFDAVAVDRARRAAAGAGVALMAAAPSDLDDGVLVAAAAAATSRRSSS